MLTNPEVKKGDSRREADRHRSSVLVPESALGSHLCVVLSSAQAASSLLLQQCLGNCERSKKRILGRNS